MRDLAERLIAYEAKGKKPPEATPPMASLVDERLRPHLAALMGSVGFRALLSRALVLANAEIPWLRAVRVKADGSLEGLDELKARWLGRDSRGLRCSAGSVSRTSGDFHRRRFDTAVGARIVAETAPQRI
jgi:hypothetical protein